MRIAPRPEVLTELGTLEAVVYKTKKRGEKNPRFYHEFEGPKPTLAMDIDNRTLHIVEGSYTVTPAGIEG
jgi:hypothetical protein